MLGMNRCLGAIAVLCSLASAALGSTTVSGNLKDLTGTAVTNRTFVRFNIRNCGGNQPRKVGTGVIVPNFYDLTPDASGIISGTLYDNSEIQCGTTTNTWYGVVITRDGKPAPEVSYLLAAGTFNLNSGTPLSTAPSSSFSANAVITNPVGDQVVSQPSATNMRVSRLEGCRYADQFATIQAAITDASTTGCVVIPPDYSGTDTYSNSSGIQVYDQRRLSAAPNRQRGYINMLTDCGLKGDGTTDDSTAANACFALYPGYEFFFPKTKANGSCNYLFNSTLTPTGPGWIISGGGGGSYTTNFGTHVGGTELCFAPGVTGILMDNVGFSGTVEDISLNGQSGAGSQGTPTLLNLPPVSTIYTRNISAIQRATQVLTVTVSAINTEGLTAQVGSLLSIAGVVGDATMNGPCLVSALSNTSTNPLTFTCSQQGADSGPFGAVGTVAPYTTGTSTADGIQVCGNFHTIRHVGIANFGRHGINAASNESGCAVQFSDDLIIRDSVIAENQGFGIFMRGNDSNAGLMSGNALYYNGLWGGYDTSFLGNTWIANQASYNGLSNAVGTAPATKAISSISRALSGGVSTVSVVLSVADVNIKVGSAVVIAGVTDTSFNTTAGSAFFVTALTDSTHYQYIQPGAPANASSSGGTSRMAKFSEANLASGLDQGSYKIGVAAAVWNQAFISNYVEGGQNCKFGQSVFVLFGPNLPSGCVPNSGVDWQGMWMVGSVAGFAGSMASNLQMFTSNLDNSFGYQLRFRAGISGGATRPFGFNFYDNNTNTASWSQQVTPAGTTAGAWEIARGAAGGGGIFRLRLFGATNSSGITRLNSESTGAVQFNKDANSGTGGIEVDSGGASPTTVATIDSTGLGTFNGGVKAGASGSTIADTRALVQSVSECGTTTTCANTANNSDRLIHGNVALVSASPSQATVSSISPAFTSTATYNCTATPEGATAAIAAGGIAISKVSGSSFTLTGPNTVSTIIDYACVGH